MAEVFGLPIDDLPEGWQPIDAVVLIKCINPASDSSPYTLALRLTDGLPPWETIGMAEWLRHQTLHELAQDD